MATPPTQIDAATRCTQSAASESGVEFGSVPWWLASERPVTRSTESASAGHRSCSVSSTQARSRSVATTEKPTVITRKAIPNRVFSAKGCRSP